MTLRYTWRLSHCISYAISEFEDPQRGRLKSKGDVENGL